MSQSRLSPSDSQASVRFARRRPASDRHVFVRRTLQFADCGWWFLRTPTGGTRRDNGGTAWAAMGAALLVRLLGDLAAQRSMDLLQQVPPTVGWSAGRGCQQRPHSGTGTPNRLSRQGGARPSEDMQLARVPEDALAAVADTRRHHHCLSARAARTGEPMRLRRY